MTWTYIDLATRCGKPVKLGDGSFKALCPAHNDINPSLHISPATDGSTLVRCQAGCEQSLVWEACMKLMSGIAGNKPAPPPPSPTSMSCIIPVPSSASMPDQIKHSKFGTPSRIYEYRDLEGQLCFLNCRFEFDPPHETEGTKTHRPYSYTTNGWRWKAPDSGRRTPYRAQHLKPAGTVMVHEGEKAADAGAVLLPDLSHLGWYGGALNAHCTDWTMIAGRDVWLLPDADKPDGRHPQGVGVAGMQKLAGILHNHGCTVRFCRNVHEALLAFGIDTDEHRGFDAADAVELGWNHDQFISYLDAAVDDAEALDQQEPESDDAVATFTASLDQMKSSRVQLSDSVIPIGYNKDNYYYLSRATKQIHTLSPSQHKRISFLSLCPVEAFWESYGGHTKRGPDWDNCSARMMDECHRAGLFDYNNLRGRGAWDDDGKTVLHLGNRLIIDGKEYDVMERPGRFIYELAPTLKGPSKTAMTDEECADYYDLCDSFCWEDPTSSDYLMGWIILAPICGSLHWRPHIWLSGPPGSGKSTIQNQFVRRLLDNMVLMVQGNSTEAGIRQMLSHDALPVIIDEAEQEDEASKARNELIIQMIRQSSSDTESQTYKGGVNGNATSYHIRSMFMLASIAIGLRRSADMTRVTPLILTEATPDNDWPTMSRLLNGITPEVSQRLIKRAIDLIPVIRKNTDTIAGLIKAMTGSQRTGDQYGVLLAGSEAMKHRRIISEDEAAEIIERHKDTLQKQIENRRHDETECLNYLTQALIKMERGSGVAVTLSIRELVAIVCVGHTHFQKQEADMTLQRYGLRVDQETGTLRIANSHSQLEKLLHNTPWKYGWTQFLKHVPGVTPAMSQAGKEVKIRFAGGNPVRALQVPLGLIISEEEMDLAATAAEERMPF